MPIVHNPYIIELWKEGRISEALHQPLQKPLSLVRTWMQKDHEPDEKDIITDKLGDFLYDFLRINPMVLRGVDFDSVESLDNIFSFSVFARNLQSLKDAAYQGNTDRIMTYISQQEAAFELQALGHEIDFPSHSDNAGWDIMVDGHRYQVMCLRDIEGVREHLARYPDIPLLVNREIADKLDDLDNVYIMPGLSYNDILSQTKNTIKAAANLNDFEIPWNATIISSARNLKRIWYREENWQHGIFNVFTDVSARWLISQIGHNFLAITGGILFGPAGALVGGGVGAILGAQKSKKVAQWLRGILLHPLINQTQDLLKDLMAKAAAELDGREGAWENKVYVWKKLLSNKSHSNRQVLEYLEERCRDDRAYYLAKKEQLLQAAMNPEILGSDILERLERGLILVLRSAVHPSRLQKEYKQLFSSINRILNERRDFDLS